MQKQKKTRNRVTKKSPLSLRLNIELQDRLARYMEFMEENGTPVSKISVIERAIKEYLVEKELEHGIR